LVKFVFPILRFQVRCKSTGRFEIHGQAFGYDSVHCRIQVAKPGPVWAIALVFTMDYNRPRQT
jgi:hypothetical protein